MQNRRWTAHTAPVNPAALRRARFISFAGVDGAGKTTQAQLLADWLRARGHRVALYVPQVPAPVRAVRSRLAGHAGLLGQEHTRLISGFLRYRSWRRAVLPELEAKDFVITDRFAACYYASVRAVGARTETLLRRVYRTLPRPDLTFFLAIPPAAAQDRVDARGDDHHDLGYLTDYDRAYRELPEFADFTVIDADAAESLVQAELREQVERHFPGV